jgi:hypothetical protein
MMAATTLPGSGVGGPEILQHRPNDGAKLREITPDRVPDDDGIDV